jgi:DNA-directed RNA polymerase subunit alpha
MLKTPLEDLDLSVRAFNCLKAAKINSLSELVQYEQEDLMKFRNFGQKSLSEIDQVLHERGLELRNGSEQVEIRRRINNSMC